VLNAKKLKRLKLTIIGLLLGIVGFLVHDYLAKSLQVFPNPGLSFGLYSNLLLIGAFLVLVVIMALFWRRGNLCLMVIIIGGLINFIDRIIFGYVRDYWSFGLVYNNLPDWIIFFGVLCSIVMLWKKK
jgi:lipoprotein signal peptidase